MTGKYITILLIMASMIAGCDSSARKSRSNIPVSSTDQRKIELMDAIRQKYENPEAHYELGKIYHADGLWSKAEFEFNVTIGFDPTHRRAQAAMVKTLRDSGNSAREKLTAEIYMNQAGSSAADSLLLGKAFQKEFMDEYALSCYQQALVQAPNSAALHRQIGYYYLAKNDRVRAEEYLRRSFQLDPYQAEVAGELGRMGVMVQIPRKVQKNTKSLDKMLDSKTN